jgi:hypothetical protein
MSGLWTQQQRKKKESGQTRDGVDPEEEQKKGAGQMGNIQRAEKSQRQDQTVEKSGDAAP